MVAGHSAWVLSWLTLGPRDVVAWIWALIPALFWGIGVLRGSPTVLLVTVPLVWALPAFLDVGPPLEPQAGLARVVTLLAYVVASAAYLAHRSRTQVVLTAVRWKPAGGDLAVRPPPPDGAPGLEGWVGALLVLGPGLGLLLSAGLGGTLSDGFGSRSGLVAAGLCALGTLLGLAMATDLHRARAPRVGHWPRAWRMAAVVLVAMSSLWGLR